MGQLPNETLSAGSNSIVFCVNVTTAIGDLSICSNRFTDDSVVTSVLKSKFSTESRTYEY
jgi:hypothetical protein